MTVLGGAGALLPILPERLAELRAAQEGFRYVIDEFIANGRSWPLETSAHAPEALRAEFTAARVEMKVAVRKSNGERRMNLPQRPRVSNWQATNFVSSRGAVITSELPLEETRLLSTDSSTDKSTESPTAIKANSLHAIVEKPSRHTSPGGTNPEAAPFKPAAQDQQSLGLKAAPFKRGICAPEEFLAQIQAMEITKKIEAAGTDRRVILKNLPEDAKITDVFCLIFNGQVDQVTMEGRDASVDFITSESAQAYYDKVSSGILVGEYLITVERGVSPKLSHHIANCLKTNTTRVVHAIVPSDMTLGQLSDSAKGLEIEHIEYHDEPDKDPRAYFFFTGINDGYEMMRKLITAPEWSGSRSSPNFLADPCTAASFHTNTLNASPMSRSTIVEAAPEANNEWEVEGEGNAEAEAEAEAGFKPDSDAEGGAGLDDSNDWEIRV